MCSPSMNTDECPHGFAPQDLDHCPNCTDDPPVSLLHNIAASLPEFTDDPLDRLRHTLAAHRDTDPASHAVTATAGGAYLGHDWTGLTYGDLSAILSRLDDGATTMQPTPTSKCEANGRASFPCSGPVNQWVVFTSPSTGRETMRTPVCRGHAQYELDWHAAVGGIAKLTLENM